LYGLGEEHPFSLREKARMRGSKIVAEDKEIKT